MPAAELEIALHRRDAESYHVDLRFLQPGSDADVRPSYEDLGPLRVATAALARHNADPAAYGRELARQLFTEAKVQAAFDMARAVAESQESALRVRLFIGPSAPELHNLRWETLLDPASGTPLLTNENIVFSRYLSSLDWRPVRLQPQRDLKALVVVASPSDITGWGMAEVKVEVEVETVLAGLGEIGFTALTDPTEATMEKIVEHLHDEVDILYLVAHGALRDGEPYLYLTDDAGKTAVVPGSELVTRLRELPVRPRLVVLASCQSAGKATGEVTAQDDGALAGLGPRLAEAGVPAVLAMQGNVSMETVRSFVPVFFEELRRDGQIDRAMAVARGRVRDRPDWWMPVLFMRLRHGQLFAPAIEFERLPFEPETVPVPAGPFLMGSEAGTGTPAAETPQCSIDLDTYHIGKYPVTNREFEHFIKAKGLMVVPELGWDGQTPVADKRDHPVAGVTLQEALAYCQWLSEETGRDYMLPSEAHWEKAARSNDGRVYPWGDAWQDGRCNHSSDDACAVDKFPEQGEYGVCDLIGNVREWTCSLWGERLRQPDERFAYPWQDDERNAPDANDQIRRVWRGGGYADKESILRCAARGVQLPNSRGAPHKRCGFRIVLKITKE